MPIFQKTEGYLGVDLGAGGIKMVELHKTKGRPQLWTYGVAHQSLDIHPQLAPRIEEALMVPNIQTSSNASAEAIAKKGMPAVSLLTPDDIVRTNEYAHILKTLADQSKVTTRRVTASLPVSQVFHAVITLPIIDEKEIDAHVKAKAQKMLPLPIEEMQVVHQVIKENGSTDAQRQKEKYLRILITAAPKRLIAFYTTIFQKGGFELQELETEAFAIERCLVGRDGGTVMVIDIGAERSNFFIMDKGVPVTHRSIQTGGNSMDLTLAAALGIDPQKAGQIKYDLSSMKGAKIPMDIWAPLFDPVIKEIQYGFDLFLSQSGNEQKRPEKIILTGGAALFPPFSQYIQEHFPLKVFVGDPWARVVYQQGLRRVLDKVGPGMAVSIGLAMRNIV
jgi:type IV pilus assembly protein PilM